MSQIIRNYLTQIYKNQDIDATYKNLQDVIQEAKAKLPQQPSDELFSERDSILITYADSLQKSDENPLQTLHQFGKKHLEEAISHIHLLPFYPYSSDDGFSVQDFYAVNPTSGTWEDIEALGQDFSLMFDAVFNHMSAQSEWFHKFLADDPEFRGLFFTESPETDLSSVTRPRTSPLLTEFKKSNGETVHVWTTFSADQVDFDFRTPETLIRLIKILLFYIEKGATVIRLDAIAYIWKEAGKSSIHMPQAHAIIQLMRAVLDEAAPHVMLITETNVPHEENVSYFGDGKSEAQMVYNFTLPPLVFYTLLFGNTTKFYDWVDTLKTPSDRTTFFNFTASHDGIGVRPVEGILSKEELQKMVEHVEKSWGRVSYKTNSDGSKSPYELNVTYVDALIDPSESQELQVKRFIMSQAIAMSLAGVPAIYIHSLLGSRNYIDGMAATGHNRTINRAKMNVDIIEKAVEDTRTFRHQVFHTYLQLLRLRTQMKAFHPNAQQETVRLGNTGVFALLRTGADEYEKVLAVYNVTNQAQKINLSAHFSEPAYDLISKARIPAESEMTAYQMFWLKLS